MPQFSLPLSLLFLPYINDVPKITNNKYNNNISKLILFANDTNLKITSSNHSNFIEIINGTFTDSIDWFKANCVLWVLSKQVSYNF